MEKEGILDQNPVENLFELPECLSYDYQLKKIVSCFLGMIKTSHSQFLLHHNNLVSCYGQQCQRLFSNH